MSKKNLKMQSKTNWDQVNKLKDKDINCSDIPELDDAFFKKAKVEMPHTNVQIQRELNILATAFKTTARLNSYYK